MKLLRDMAEEKKNSSKSVVRKDQIEKLDYNLHGLLKQYCYGKILPCLIKVGIKRKCVHKKQRNPFSIFCYNSAESFPMIFLLNGKVCHLIRTF